MIYISTGWTSANSVEGRVCLLWDRFWIQGQKAVGRNHQDHQQGYWQRVNENDRFQPGKLGRGHGRLPPVYQEDSFSRKQIWYHNQGCKNLPQDHFISNWRYHSFQWRVRRSKYGWASFALRWFWLSRTSGKFFFSFSISYLTFLRLSVMIYHVPA